MSVSYNRRAQVARQRAYRRLADAFLDDFVRLHDEERARVGLEPPDPSKWQVGHTVGPTATAPATTRALRRTSDGMAVTPATRSTGTLPTNQNGPTAGGSDSDRRTAPTTAAY